MFSSRLFCSTLQCALGLATVVDPLDPSSCLVLLEVRRSCLRCRCSSAPTPSLLKDPWLVSMCFVLPVASAQQAHHVKSGNVVSIVLWPPCADDDDTCLNRNIGLWPQDALASRALESPRKPRRIQESSGGRPRRAQESVSEHMGAQKRATLCGADGHCTPQSSCNVSYVLWCGWQCSLQDGADAIFDGADGRLQCKMTTKVLFVLWCGCYVPRCGCSLRKKAIKVTFVPKWRVPRAAHFSRFSFKKMFHRFFIFFCIIFHVLHFF